MPTPERVIIIAGPSCVGKTTLIGELQRREHRALAAGLGLHEPDEWVYRNARGMSVAGKAGSERCVVLHYDIIRPLMEDEVTGFEDDPGLAGAIAAQSVRVCSMWARGPLLRERARLKMASRSRIDLMALCAPRQWWVRQRRTKAIRAWYRDESFIENRYALWFEFITSLANVEQHFVLDAHESDRRVVPFDDWADPPSGTCEVDSCNGVRRGG